MQTKESNEEKNSGSANSEHPFLRLFLASLVKAIDGAMAGGKESTAAKSGEPVKKKECP